MLDWKAVAILGVSGLLAAGVWIGVNAYRSATDQTVEVQTRQAAAQTPPQPAPGPLRRAANRVRTGAARATERRRVARTMGLAVPPSAMSDRIKSLYYDGEKLVRGETAAERPQSFTSGETGGPTRDVTLGDIVGAGMDLLRGALD